MGCCLCLAPWLPCCDRVLPSTAPAANNLNFNWVDRQPGDAADWSVAGHRQPRVFQFWRANDSAPHRLRISMQPMPLQWTTTCTMLTWPLCA